MPRGDTEQAGQPARLFEATNSFAATVEGRTVSIRKGQLVDAGDPVLTGRQSLFTEYRPQVRQYGQPRVEQATAAPGEKRK